MNKRWEWLAELANIHGWESGVELGVAEGRFTTYLLEQVPGIHMTAVDLWEEGKNELEDYKGIPMDYLFSTFAQNMASYGSRVEVLRMSTVDAAQKARDADFVFIDADHSYQAVLNDIDAWKGKAKFLCGHDYSWPSVRKAVQERFEEVERGPDNCWGVWV